MGINPAGAITGSYHEENTNLHDFVKRTAPSLHSKLEHLSLLVAAQSGSAETCEVSRYAIASVNSDPTNVDTAPSLQ